MKKALSISQANGLYLVTMLLVVTLGSAVQAANLSWGLMATEVLLILLPAAIFLRKNGVPLREGLRKRPVGLGAAVLCTLVGMSTWFYTSYIDGLMIQISGLPLVAIQEGMLPKGVIESAVYFAALAIFAPICEEALFRGAIQGAYERKRSAVFAITISSLMFAFYHFRLTGLPALLPIAFTLGYVGWRTWSLYAAILVHFGNNAVAAAYTLLALNLPSFKVSITNPAIAAVGLAVSLGLLYLISRKIPAPTKKVDEQEAAPSAPKQGWLKVYWPLVASGLLFAAISGLTVVAALMTGLTPGSGVTFDKPAWKEAVEYRYAITNRAGDEVGEATCRITPGAETIQLDCQRSVRQYEVQTGSSFFSEGTHSLNWSAKWDSETLDLVAFDLERFDEQGKQALAASLEGTRLTVASPGDDGEDAVDLGDGALLAFEWPWRGMYLKAEAGFASNVPFGYLLTWDEDAQRSRPQVREELLRLSPLDPVTVPAGRFDAWKVTIKDDKAAWYSTDSTPVLLRYDDGMHVYSLVNQAEDALTPGPSPLAGRGVPPCRKSYCERVMPRCREY